DAVEVYGLLRPNLDAHDYDPSPADLDALARADVILANGVGLEPWLDAAVQASGTDTPVTDTSEGALLLTGDEDHDHGHDGETAQGDDHADETEPTDADAEADEHADEGASTADEDQADEATGED